MKRTIILLIAILTALPSLLQAQGKNDDIYIAYSKNEIYLQYGTPSIVELTNKLGSNTYRTSQYSKEQGVCTVKVGNLRECIYCCKTGKPI